MPAELHDMVNRLCKHGCYNSFAAPVKEAELSFDSSTPVDDFSSRANIFSQEQLPITIRSRILCTQNQVPCSSRIAQTP